MEGTAHDYQKSTVAVSKALGLELPEIPGWICCGSTSAHQTDALLSVALPAKSLVAAGGKPVAVGCAACYSRLKAANYEIANNPEMRKTVAGVVGKDYDGKTEILHLLEILARDVGMRKIAEATKKPLKGIKVVTYYGCLLSRPPEVTQFDDPENPDADGSSLGSGRRDHSGMAAQDRVLRGRLLHYRRHHRQEADSGDSRDGQGRWRRLHRHRVPALSDELGFAPERHRKGIGRAVQLAGLLFHAAPGPCLRSVPQGPGPS
jgi:hypothetical protein